MYGITTGDALIRLDEIGEGLIASSGKGSAPGL